MRNQRHHTAVKRGEWNDVRGFVGMPGTGKSTLMVRELVRMVPRSYVIAHDPNWNLPPRLPDGTETGIVRHGDVGSLIHRLRRNPRGIHTLGGDAEEATNAALLVARMGFAGPPGEEWGVPVVLAFDEVAVWRELQRETFGPVALDLFARHRPHHVAVWWGAQYPSMVGAPLLSQAMDLYLFRTDDIYDLQRLERRAKVPPAMVAKLSTLKKFEHKRFRRGL